MHHLQYRHAPCLHSMPSQISRRRCCVAWPTSSLIRSGASLASSSLVTPNRTTRKNGATARRFLGRQENSPRQLVPEQLLDGITADELRGMLLRRRAEPERALERRRHHLTGVQARLRHIAQEDDMPADDIVVRQVTPLGWS